MALGAFDDAAVRGGVVRHAKARGIDVLAHSPFGGPKKKAQLARMPALAEAARTLGVTPQEVFLAYLLDVDPQVVPIVGARTPDAARGAAAAARLELGKDLKDALDRAFPTLASLRAPASEALWAASPSALARENREVVLIMGIAGAGKSRLAERYVAEGYLRLNRDTEGGSLRALSRRLEACLEGGVPRLVLDNTYLSRADRHDVIAAAARHGAAARCVFLDTLAHEAQTNVVLRMLRRYGRLLGPEEMAANAKKDPGIVRPTTLFRMLREIERPAEDEGFASISVVSFARDADDARATAASVFPVDALFDLDGEATERNEALSLLGRAPEGPVLLFGWKPDATAAWIGKLQELAASLAVRAGRPVEVGVCAHPAGPPVCFCRPPLPGLFTAFAERWGVAPEKSVVLARTSSERTFARAIGLAPLS